MWNISYSLFNVELIDRWVLIDSFLKELKKTNLWLLILCVKHYLEIAVGSQMTIINTPLGQLVELDGLSSLLI